MGRMWQGAAFAPPRGEKKAELLDHLAVVVVRPFCDPILVGEFTTHFRTYFSGDWDVHWGWDFDP